MYLNTHTKRSTLETTKDVSSNRNKVARLTVGSTEYVT